MKNKSIFFSRYKIDIMSEEEHIALECKEFDESMLSDIEKDNVDNLVEDAIKATGNLYASHKIITTRYWYFLFKALLTYIPQGRFIKIAGDPRCLKNLTKALFKFMTSKQSAILTPEQFTELLDMTNQQQFASNSIRYSFYIVENMLHLFMNYNNFFRAVSVRNYNYADQVFNTIRSLILDFQRQGLRMNMEDIIKNYFKYRILEQSDRSSDFSNYIIHLYDKYSEDDKGLHYFFFNIHKRGFFYTLIDYIIIVKSLELFSYFSIIIYEMGDSSDLQDSYYKIIDLNLTKFMKILLSIPSFPLRKILQLYRRAIDDEKSLMAVFLQKRINYTYRIF